MAQKHSRANFILKLSQRNDFKEPFEEPCEPNKTAGENADTEQIVDDLIEASASKSFRRKRPFSNSSWRNINPSFLPVKRKLNFDIPGFDDENNNTNEQEIEENGNNATQQQKETEKNNSHTTEQETEDNNNITNEQEIEENVKNMMQQQKETVKDKNNTIIHEKCIFFGSITPPRPVAVRVDPDFDEITNYESPSVLMTLKTVPSTSKLNNDLYNIQEAVYEKTCHGSGNELIQDDQSVTRHLKENNQENQLCEHNNSECLSSNENNKLITIISNELIQVNFQVENDPEKNNHEHRPNENNNSASIASNELIQFVQPAVTCPEEDVQDHPRKSRPKKGRKLKHPPQNRKTRKLNNIQNKSRYSQNDSYKEPKEFRQYICKCNCLNTIGIETAKREFTKFYSVDSHAAQRALICAMVTEVPIKRKRNKNSNKKTCTRKYMIDEKRVCKTFFVQTLRVSNQKVTAALKSMKRPEGVKDLRGVAGGHNKTKPEMFNAVIEHIKKFPKYKSHYRRAQTEQEYLAPNTTLRVMYKCYKGETRKNERVSKATYKNIFYKNFNLRRKKLKQDTCNTCDKLEILITNESGPKKADFEKEKYEHCEKAETVRDAMKKAIKNCKTDAETEVLTFDLEKTLPMPRIPTNVVFYLRQLWLYNAGIYSGKTDKSFCYVWVEGEAGRGAQEVGSCLRKHILSDQFPKVKNLILWSDSCGGQNRNIKIVLMMKCILEEHPTLEKITLNYLIPGHSYLQNDNDFGDVERALKLQQRLYTPQDYMNVMASCRTKNPLKTVKMDKTDFISTEEMEKAIVNRKKDSNGEKINWLKLRQIEIKKDEPFKIYVKTTVGEAEAMAQIDLEKKRGRRGATFRQMVRSLWPNRKPVSDKKIKDIKSLFAFIPNDALPFYRNLVSDERIEDDIEGFDGELDFEPHTLDE